ncbi:MAG TPA: YbdD/YjiX family protein [Steroidobacteraceae bacterium]
MKERWHALWNLIRALARDDAYERYLAHHARSHPDRAPLDRRSFYLIEQERKWTGVARCC